MLILIIIFACVAAGLFCWSLFELAALALPVMVGVTAAGWAYQSGAGAISAVLLGLAAGLGLFGTGHFLFLIARPLWARTVIIAAFVGPAVACGYLAAFGIVRHLMPSQIWQCAFAAVGAGVVGVAAFKRIDQVEDVGLAVMRLVGEADRLRLDGDTALALDIHAVKHLLRHLALGEPAGDLDRSENFIYLPLHCWIS